MHLVNSGRVAIIGLMAAGVALVAADAATGATAVPAAAATATIEIRTGSCPATIYCYTPDSLTVTVGDLVRWTDVSGTPHTVTRCTIAACDGHDGGTGTDASFTRADIDTGHDFTHVFSAPGTYTYYCELHGYLEMHGTIVVQAAPVATTTTSPASTTTTTAGSTTATSSVTTPNGGTNSAPVTATTSRAGPASADSGARLAKTGSSLRLVFVIGGTLIAIGAVLASTRRRARQSIGDG
jgi:plastocyanin